MRFDNTEKISVRLVLLIVDDDPYLIRAQFLLRLCGRLGLMQTGEFVVVIVPVHHMGNNVRNTPAWSFYQMYVGGKYCRYIYYIYEDSISCIQTAADPIDGRLRDWGREVLPQLSTKSKVPAHQKKLGKTPQNDKRSPNMKKVPLKNWKRTSEMRKNGGDQLRKEGGVQNLDFRKSTRPWL